MARITVNVRSHPDPSLIEEDIEIAAGKAGIRDFVVTQHDNDCFTLDAYSDADVPLDQFDRFPDYLPPDGSYQIDHIPNWPPRGWEYAEKEIKY